MEALSALNPYPYHLLPLSQQPHSPTPIICCPCPSNLTPLPLSSAPPVPHEQVKDESGKMVNDYWKPSVALMNERVREGGGDGESVGPAGGMEVWRWTGTMEAVYRNE